MVYSKEKKQGLKSYDKENEMQQLHAGYNNHNK